MGSRVEDHWRVRVCVASEEELSVLRRTFSAEILQSTRRLVDASTFLIEAIVPEGQLQKLKAAHPVRVLDNINRTTAEASRWVSKVNRYRKD